MQKPWSAAKGGLLHPLPNGLDVGPGRQVQVEGIDQVGVKLEPDLAAIDHDGAGLPSPQ